MSRSQNKRSLCCISRQTLGNNKFVARLRIRYVRTYKCNDFQNRTYRGGTCRGWGCAHRCRDCASCDSHQSQPKPTIEVQTPQRQHARQLPHPPPWSDCCLCSSRPKKPHARHLPHPPPWSDCCLCSSQKKSNVSSQCPALQFPSNKRTGMYVFSSP